MKVSSKKYFINGQSGALESYLQTPDNGKNDTLAIICHPLPTEGGTMHNKVIYTVGQAFHSLGINTLKFNTRGVGLSEGSFDSGNGETADLLSVINHCCDEFNLKRLYLAGFSFGSFLVNNSCRYDLPINIYQQLLIAPPVDRYPFYSSSQANTRLMVIQGTEDELISEKNVKDWYNQESKHYATSIYKTLPQASHFFHGKLINLRECVIKYLYQ